jgi:tRNA(Ile)-lysidine synthase
VSDLPGAGRSGDGPLHPAVAAVRSACRRAVVDAAGSPPSGAEGPVLVACSGGADSLALLAGTVFVCRRAGRRVVGVTVDHALQDGSAEHTARVVAQMAALGVDETASARVRVTAAGQGPEAAAREARYAVLTEMAARLGSGLVLLGHTLDDQAETVLLGLARGSGARSLSGMRAAFSPFRRPLLGVSRAETEAACRAEGIVWWSDPHNDDPRFTRSRVRHRVLPVLEEELGPGVAAALARTADQLRDDAELLDELADEAAGAAVGAGGGLDADRLARTPTALRHRVLRRAALEAGAPAGELSRGHVLAMDELVTGWRGQRWVDLPGHLHVVREQGELHVRRTDGCR